MADARLERDAQSGEYWLVGELSFQTVPALVEQGARLLAETSELRINLGRVSRSDSAGVALLTEWVRLARQRGRRIHLIGLPEQMRAIVRVCGLEHVLPFETGVS